MNIQIKVMNNDIFAICLDRIDDFLDYFDKDDIVNIEGETVEFDRYDFDGESTKVLVFKK